MEVILFFKIEKNFFLLFSYDVNKKIFEYEKIFINEKSIYDLI